MGNRKGEDDELGRALDAYVDGLAAERGLTEDSAVNVRRAARRWCRFLGWSWEGFASATRWDAERWVGEMGARSLAASTVSGNLWCLRAVYERAVACGDVGRNPFEGMAVRRSGPRPEPVAPSELRRVLAVARADAGCQGGRVTHIAASLRIRCNLDYGEIAGASVRDYSRGAGGAFLRCVSRRRGQTVVPLAAETADAIDEYLALRGDNCGPYAPLLLSHTGGRSTAHALSTRVSRLCRKAGVAIGKRSITAGMLELAKEEGATPAEVVALSRAEASGSRVLSHALGTDCVGGADIVSAWQRANEGLAHPSPLAVGTVTRDQLLVAAMGADGIREVAVWPDGTVSISIRG